MSAVLTTRDLYLVYQAQWQHGGIVSYEALLRHQSGGAVFPRSYFEELSLPIQTEITLAIVAEVMQQINRVSLPIAFNLPARLLSTDFVEAVTSLQKNTAPGLLRCEIVEDEALQEADMRHIQQLSQGGIVLVVDDLIERYSVDNLAMFETYDIPCIIKVEMKPEYRSMVEQYRHKGYTIIQEGDWIDTESGDILQSNSLSIPERL